MGEGLYIGQVVVRTVFLKPLADILLGPQHHRFGQTGQSGTGVVYRQGFTRTQLKHTQKSGELALAAAEECVREREREQQRESVAALLAQVIISPGNT